MPIQLRRSPFAQAARPLSSGTLAGAVTFRQLTASGLLAYRPGRLAGFVVTAQSVAGAVTVYDNRAASGTVLQTVASPVLHQYYPANAAAALDVAAATAMYAAVGGTQTVVFYVGDVDLDVAMNERFAEAGSAEEYTMTASGIVRLNNGIYRGLRVTAQSVAGVIEVRAGWTASDPLVHRVAAPTVTSMWYPPRPIFSRTGFYVVHGGTAQTANYVVEN